MTRNFMKVQKWKLLCFTASRNRKNVFSLKNKHLVFYQVKREQAAANTPTRETLCSKKRSTIMKIEVFL